MAPEDSRTRFERFTDRLNEVWAGSPWFAFCIGGFASWLAVGPLAKFSDSWHLWANTPTTWLGFFGIFALHNNQHRFELATNERLHEIIERLPELPADPVDDPGQRPDRRG